MNEQPEQEPSKVTKILVNAIHGGRKQDSKFWQSEFSEADSEKIMLRENKKRLFLESVIFFLLFFVGIGVVSYGGLFLYKRYAAEFTTPKQGGGQRTVAKRTTGREAGTEPIPRLDNRAITQEELDQAIQKALAEKSRGTEEKNLPQTDQFYYRVELVNGGKIEAESASRDGDMLTIKDRKGLVITVNRAEIKNVKKVKM
ncbi:MAG: hypothetical protein KJ804_11825 [Proteobacteria bacterium]|nr:hypothetical protein [Pseudomonadota bacterium]MBU1058991.1 hypothetical protein [Pseudomonadota bacterium]